MGKGSKRRPLSVTQDKYDKEYEAWLKKVQEAKSKESL